MTSEKGPNNILVVDDAMPIVKLLARLLPKLIRETLDSKEASPLKDFFLLHGITKETTVLTADDGVDALPLWEKGDVAFVITDFNMPCMSGDLLVKAIRHAGGNLPVMGMSGEEVGRPQSGETAKTPFKDAGANAFVTKPIDIDKLRSGMLAAFNNELQNEEVVASTAECEGGATAGAAGAGVAAGVASEISAAPGHEQIQHATSMGILPQTVGGGQEVDPSAVSTPPNSPHLPPQQASNPLPLLDDLDALDTVAARTSLPSSVSAASPPSTQVASAAADTEAKYSAAEDPAIITWKQRCSVRALRRCCSIS